MHISNTIFYVYLIVGFLLAFTLLHLNRRVASVNLQEFLAGLGICIIWPLAIIPVGIWFVVNHGDDVTVFHSYKESKRIRDAKRGFDN